MNASCGNPPVAGWCAAEMVGDPAARPFGRAETPRAALRYCGMARPKADDPYVQFPLRLRRSGIDRIREVQDEDGLPSTTEAVRQLLSLGARCRLGRCPHAPAAPVPPAPLAPAPARADFPRGRAGELRYAAAQRAWAAAGSALPWRVGRKLGRTLYVGDEVVGMVDTPELAARIVAAMNAGLG